MSGVSQPSQLTPADQDALVKQIGIALMRAAPQEWQQIRTEYRAAGRYYELTTEVVDETGVSSAWTASHDIAMLFAKLRAGMHGERGGTWFNARYQIDRPSRYNLEFDRNEPHWRTPPPLQAYRDELHFFPRNDDDVPEWLMRRLSGLRPEQPGRRFRIARIFDGRGPSGRPSVNRPPVDEDEKQRLLEYLERSPLILPERGHDIDRLSPDAGQTVPVAFHCDGIWIWPAAVNYYLRHYGLPPEPGLVENARANEFVSPEIDEASANEAAANITGGRPPGPPPPHPPEHGTPPPPVAPPGQPAPEQHSAESMAAGAPHPEPPHPGPPQHRPRGQREAPEEAEEAIALLRRRLDELGVPESAYRIGSPEPDTWFLEQLQDGWQVGWYQRDSTSPTVFDPMVFDEAADATAFLLGRLLLESGEPSGRHRDSTALFDAELSRPPEPELDARPIAPPADAPVGASALETEAEPTVYAERNGGGRHGDVGIRDAGIRAAAASANVDLAAHGYGGFGRDPVAPDQPGQEPPERPAPLGREPLDDEDDPLNGTPGATTALRTGRPGPGSAPAGFGAGPTDPAARAAALSTPTMVGASPVDAPAQHEAGGAPAQHDAGDAGEESAAPQWEIQPLSGEPPLTLFRGKRMTTLSPSTAIDRFGDENGNLTYVAGTPFEERSLVPEWVNRPYHVYELTEPLEVLTGIAIPWFDQPGGGSAYLLPNSVDELLESGELVEIEVNEHP